MDDSGQYPIPKSWRNGIWLPVSILAAVVTFAVAWGTNVNRLAQLEQQQAKEEQVRQLHESNEIDDRRRINDHLQSTDTNVTHLQDQLQYITEQLVVINQKLDQAAQERRR